MDWICGKEIEEALSSDYRVYLCGDLKQPQLLPHLYDEVNEVGLSHYRQFTADQPHYHELATEYNYILSGCSKFFLIDEGKEFILEAGSLMRLPPKTKYASKHAENTKVLFFKSPGGNDKQLVNVDERLKSWLSFW